MIKLFGRSRIINYDEILTFCREPKTLYLDGKKVFVPACQYQVRGNVQPINAKDLIMVPEHDRFLEEYWIYYNNSDIKFLTDVGDLGVNALITVIIINDRVVRNGINFQVQQVENWSSYARAKISKIDIGPNKSPESPR